ncbi:hypothetical protein B5S29_g1126 [[Candida] boidinii]|uniref:Unnamed protein product n=1 Tax=Candida boidinii TaxID=5477 RepID=A0ACB5TKK9_CANBO|nr:hypothetical protein B5S29_g1126 [[Candida] boidinii]GME89264.1 unnamed protein product [[Candida] boidinii]GME96367.1 unnamed protein product [[Candida] boidinii]
MDFEEKFLPLESDSCKNAFKSSKSPFKNYKYELILILILMLFLCVISGFSIIGSNSMDFSFKNNYYYSNDQENNNKGIVENSIPLNLKIQSWNLRYDSIADGKSIEQSISEMNETVPSDDEIEYYSEYKEVSWSLRRFGIANSVKMNNIDFFTVNEALIRQVLDLEILLDMNWIGVGRDDGGEKGEFQAIFYNEDKFKLLHNSTFWLSTTPFIPSKFHDAGSIRSTTVATFKDLESGKKFTVLNTHLDDQSDDQRKLGAGLLKYRASYELQQSDISAVLLLGDFNSQSSGRSSSAYNIAIGDLNYNLLDQEIDIDFLKKYNSTMNGNFVFNDILKLTSVDKRMGNHATFTGFEKDKTNFQRIDFQFIGGFKDIDENNKNTDKYSIDKSVIVDSFYVGENWYDDSYYLSDHRPVVSELTFQ